MRILIRNTDDIVIYAQDDLILDTNLHGNNWFDPNFNNTNSYITEVDSLPNIFTGGLWTYKNGIWEVADSVRYEELLTIEEIQKIEDEKAKIKSDIAALEASVTPRRQREAILAIDTTWLADIEIQIGQLRQQLAEYDNAI